MLLMMKCKLHFFILFTITSVSFAQNKDTFWNTTSKKNNMVALDSRMQLPENKLFNLNLVSLKSRLNNAPERKANGKHSSTILSIPNEDGILEKLCWSVYH